MISITNTGPFYTGKGTAEEICKYTLASSDMAFHHETSMDIWVRAAIVGVDTAEIDKIDTRERKTAYRLEVPPETVKEEQIQAIKVPNSAIVAQEDKLTIDTKKLNREWHWYTAEGTVYFIKKTEEKVELYESKETIDGKYIAWEICEMET